MRKHRRKGTEYHSVAEVAEVFGISPWSVRRLIRCEKLPAARIGGLIKIPKKELQEWEKERRLPA